MEELVPALTYPFRVFADMLISDTGSRYYWPFLIGGTMFAGLMGLFGLAKFDRKSLSMGYWFGKSARIDYLLTMVNPVIRIVFFGGVLAWAASIGRQWVVTPPNAETTIMLTALLTIALFVADDFMKFFTHWAMHFVPFMWSFHRVHHSAETMTFATANRQHFMEILFVSVPVVAVRALVNILFILFTGIEQAPFALAGANIILVAFNSFAGAFRHGPVWVSFGPVFEKWLISPAMHQIHHSVSERHYNKNMGGTLSVWDRLFGTWHSPTGPEELADGIGLGADGVALQSPIGVFTEPFAHAYATFQPPVSAREPENAA